MVALLPPPPEPIVVDGHNEVEVEKVLGCKTRYRWLWYLVKFKGWPDSDNEWIPVDGLTHAREFIEDFHHDHPNAPWAMVEISRSSQSSA